VNADKRKSRAIARGLRVSLAIAAFLCTAPAQARNLGGRISPFGSFFAAADLDGDHRSDVATAGESRRESAGYALDITIRLSSLPSNAITVRTARMASRFLLRDLDGDSDRDLIVESFDREPLAVVVNDGGGQFHQANLDDFRAMLRRPDSRSFEALAAVADSLEPFETLDAPVAGPVHLRREPDVVAAPAAIPGDACHVLLRHSASASRGPPCL
jgi:hypothetical protein